MTDDRPGGQRRGAARAARIFAKDAFERALKDPSICAPAGGDPKLCRAMTTSEFVRGGRALGLVGAPLSGKSWSWGALSPDGKSILAELSGGSCKLPAAWIFHGNVGTGFNATPLVWTTDGRMIAFVREQVAGIARSCRPQQRPGLYLIEPLPP